MEGTYEYELERAELLGIEPPSKEAWEEKEKARKEVELEEQQNEVAKEAEEVEETIKSTQGKMDELNSILSATQGKINKFRSVCGSFTSLLKIRTGSPAPDRKASSDQPSGSINDALDDLDKMKVVQSQSDVEFVKSEVQDISKKATKKFDALDSLLAKTEKADLSMQHQNQQMKSYLRK